MSTVLGFKFKLDDGRVFQEVGTGRTVLNLLPRDDPHRPGVTVNNKGEIWGPEDDAAIEQYRVPTEAA